MDEESERDDRGPWSLVIDQGLPLLTAVLGLLAAAAGLWGVRANEDRAELDDQVGSIEAQVGRLEEDNDALRSELDAVTQSRDEWRARAEAADDAGSVETLPPAEALELVVTPDTVPAGVSDPLFTFTGEGFGANGRVRLHVGTPAGGMSEIREVRADADGRFVAADVPITIDDYFERQWTLLFYAESLASGASAEYPVQVV